jgi:hypothetical protein
MNGIAEVFPESGNCSIIGFPAQYFGQFIRRVNTV